MKLLFAFAAIAVFFFHPSPSSKMPTFNHTTVYVVDMNASNEFYKNVMQFKEINEPFHDGRHTWYAIAPHVQLHVVQGAKEKTLHDVNIHMAFTVESLQDFRKHLDQMHIRYGNFDGSKKEAQNRPDGVQQIYLQDPDGYWIEINNDRF